MPKGIKKYTPLIAIELYLILTLIFFWFGPIKYRITNEIYFIVLIFLYHFFFIIGYIINVKLFIKKPLVQHKFSIKIFYILCLFAFLGSLITYKTATNSSSFIPYTIFQDIVKGIQSPAQVYIDSKLDYDYASAGDSRLMNILFIFFAFTKFYFIFYSIWFWKQLGYFNKIISCLYFFFYISPSISSGVNSLTFWFSLFFFSTLLVYYYIKNPRKLKFILFILSVLIIIPILSFGYIMSERGGGFSYFEQSSSRGDIIVVAKEIDLENSNLFTFLKYSLTWLDYYITQGYYGFSLILEQEFNWTYGFGNSAFLQRQFNLITGIDVGELSYQRRYDNIWGEFAQWHSFYGQFANDFGPWGLIFLMFMLGFLFSRVWLTILFQNSFYGAALMPIYIIMFIFFPANNQVFGYIDTISYFIVISFFWFLEGKKIKI
jgi:hypothetical protein